MGTEVTLTFNAFNVLGVFGFILIAYGLNRWIHRKNPKPVNWRLVGAGLLIQVFVALVVLQPPVQHYVFKPIDSFVQKLLGFSKQGADFVFMSVEKHDALEYVVKKSPDGKIALDENGKAIVEVQQTTVAGRTNPAVKTFAFWILPTVIFFSAIMSLLYFFGVMQPIVRVIAKVVQRVMGTSGSETTSCSANIFMGQTEAPLVIKPFVSGMTRSELHAVMTGGFGTVAGGVLAMYAAILHGIPGIAGHLVTASTMAAPGALVISKIIYPETEESETMGELKTEVEVLDGNAVEAAARGASEGTQLVINIVGMLIAFVALVYMLDSFFVDLVTPVLQSLTGTTLVISFTKILGWAFTPFAWLMGVPYQDCMIMGQLLGEKVVLTELIAYLNLSQMIESGQISPRTQLLASYALCGFANFASVGIQIGGIGGIAPNRKADLAQMGMSAMFAGVLVTCTTATIAGIFIG